MPIKLVKYSLPNLFNSLPYSMNRVHVALFLSIPICTLLAPTVKERILALFSTSASFPAFEGDGILIADMGNYGFKFTSINWTLTQQPVYGDAYHTISFFVVPQQIAHQFLYHYNSTYTSNSFFVDGGTESVRAGLQNLNLRSNIYLLPKEYTGSRKEARAEFKVHSTRILNSESSSRSVEACCPVCQFQNRVAYSDFLDMENYSINKTAECSPPFNLINFEFNQPCEFSENSAIFTAKGDHYNFFSATVPTKSNVQFKSDILMYFYNQTKLAKYFQCRIRGVDTCSFTTVQRPWERNLIIAYTHPTTVASSLTTTISVKADVLVWHTVAYSLVCLLIPSLLIKKMYF